MIKRIRYIHSKFYIHRDIKPDNFMTGRGENEKKIYIIDFGLAKKYYSVSRAQHIKFVTGKHLIGTARYCGRNAHRGYEQGRRDDIESIGYVLMYFLLGVLPWQGLKARKNEDHFEKIAQKKYTTSFEELTAGQPEEFLNYFKHADKLEFEAQPNYIYLIGLFQSVIDKYCTDCLYDFDWKKDSCSYVSRNSNNINKQTDVSLIVHKNNDASQLDYSNIIEEEEKDENEENEENHQKKKRIKKKEVFMGEDNPPVENHEKENEKEKLKEKHNDDKNKNNNDKLKRTKSMNNIRKSKSGDIDKNINKKKNKKVKNKKNNENKHDSKKNNEISKTKPENKDVEKINESKKGINIDNNNNNEDNNNDENRNSKINSKKQANKNLVNEEANPPETKNNYDDNNKGNDYKNSVNKKKFNYDYNDSNNQKIYGNNEENNDLDTKDKNNDEQNNNDELFKEMSFEQEEGSKKRKRNRAGSFEEKKSKDENIICKCIIY